MIKNTMRVLNSNIKYGFAGFRDMPIKTQL